MRSEIIIEEVVSKGDLRAFVKFPWRVYRGDPNWVPPLIGERCRYFDTEREPMFDHIESVLLMARRDGEIQGTIAPFVDLRSLEHATNSTGRFGFFEVVDDYGVAKALLDAARKWLGERGMTCMRGPLTFGGSDSPGVLVWGEDVPPVFWEAHTPPYYKTYLERYGMEKWGDTYAWRIDRSDAEGNPGSLPTRLLRVGEAIRRRSGATIRRMDLGRWDDEVELAHHLFETTLLDLPAHIPMTLDEFSRSANEMRRILDPEFALVAEVEKKPVGFIISIPDINRALLHLNGRLYPFGWLKLMYYARRIDVLSLKMLGVLKEYRGRGIDALLYLETAKAAVANRKYKWMDFSLTSEYNPMVNRIAENMGARVYKHYRIYQLDI